MCFATFSGDLAPALLTLGAEIDLAGPAGTRTVPLADLYIGYARQDQPVTATLGDGKHYLSLRPGEFVTAVRARNTPGLRSAYDKIRIRRSIEYPVCGVAVALRRDGDTLADLRVAFTGTNPRPVLLDGTAELCGGALDERVFEGLDELVRDQIMSMKTTFTPGHYRRRVAGVLARRLVTRLFEEAIGEKVLARGGEGGRGGGGAIWEAWSQRCRFRNRQGLIGLRGVAFGSMSSGRL